MAPSVSVELRQMGGKILNIVNRQICLSYAPIAQYQANSPKNQWLGEQKQMSYYCFLCNEDHDDSLTQEHFIPRSIDGPENQWLPVCEASNTRSNSVFDNEVRDMLYLVRFENTRALKRSGEALLADGALRPFQFSYFEGLEPRVDAAFRYIYDRDK